MMVFMAWGMVALQGVLGSRHAGSGLMAVKGGGHSKALDGQQDHQETSQPKTLRTQLHGEFIA
jgi:hypothetical protein